MRFQQELNRAAYAKWCITASVVRADANDQMHFIDFRKYYVMNR